MKTYGDCASLTRGIFYCGLFTLLGVSSLAADPPKKDPTIPSENCENHQHQKCYGNRIGEPQRVMLRHYIKKRCCEEHRLKHTLQYSCWTECHAWWPLKHSTLDVPKQVPRDVFLVYATTDREKIISNLHFDPKLCEMARDENMTRIGCALQIYAVHETNDQGGHLHMGTTFLCALDNPVDVHLYVL